MSDPIDPKSKGPKEPKKSSILDGPIGDYMRSGIASTFGEGFTYDLMDHGYNAWIAIFLGFILGAFMFASGIWLARIRTKVTMLRIVLVVLALIWLTSVVYGVYLFFTTGIHIWHWYLHA